MLVPYVLTMFTVKRHMRKTSNRSVLDRCDRVISAMTTRILLAILVMYTPYCVFCATRVIVEFRRPLLVETEWLNVCLFVGYLFGCANSFVNAIIFISLNRRTQRVLFGRCFKFSIRDSVSQMTSTFRFRKNGTATSPKLATVQ